MSGGSSQRYFKEISDKNGPMYLMVEWLTTTFTLMLTNGSSWWETPSGGAQRNLSNTNFNDDQEWLETMYDALCQSQAKCTYEITWLPLRTQLRIKWPNPGDPTVPYQYNIPVGPVNDETRRGELLLRMLSTLANTRTTLQETVRSLTSTCTGLSEELRRQQEEMRQQNRKAAERDKELFIKFTILLNSKKEKLAELKARVDTLEAEVKVLNAKTDEELLAIDGLDAVLGDNHDDVHSDGAAAADSPDSIDQQVDEQQEEEEARGLQQEAAAMDVEQPEQEAPQVRMPRLTLASGPQSQPLPQSAPGAGNPGFPAVDGGHIQQWGAGDQPPPVTATQAALFAAPTQDAPYPGETQPVPHEALLKYTTGAQQGVPAQGQQGASRVGMTASALAPFYAAETLPPTFGSAPQAAHTQSQAAGGGDLDDVDVDIGL